MAKMNYDAINFKNKDVDKFATKFNQPDPGKGIVSQAKGVMNTIANSPKSKGTIDKVRDTMNATAKKKNDDSLIGVSFQEIPSKNKDERHFETPSKTRKLILKGFNK
jgi:hypothetical protein